LDEVGTITSTALTLAETRNRRVGEIEHGYLRETLSKYNGRIKDTADAAWVTTRQLHKLMKKHRLRKEDFKTPKTS